MGCLLPDLWNKLQPTPTGDDSLLMNQSSSLRILLSLSFAISLFPPLSQISLSLVCDLSGQQEGFGCKKSWVKEFCARAKSSMGRCNGPRGSGEMVMGCIVTLQVADDESWVVTRVGLVFGGTAPIPTQNPLQEQILYFFNLIFFLIFNILNLNWTEEWLCHSAVQFFKYNRCS